MQDNLGKRSQWNMPGGEERQEATELYRLAITLSEQILTSASQQYASVVKEFAEHLESRHQEQGKPQNSRWNKSFAIAEDNLSMEARYFFQMALQIYLEKVRVVK